MPEKKNFLKNIAVVKQKDLKGSSENASEVSRTTSGELEKLDVLRSSGSNILDTAAVKTVNKAAPFPYINGLIDLEVSYEFKK